MKVFTWSAVFWLVLALVVIKPIQPYGACLVTGTTPDGGAIYVCTDADAVGVVGGTGSDNITVAPGAEVGKTVQHSVDTPATADVATIDAGGGNNQLANGGKVSATAEAIAIPVLLMPSSATAVAGAVKTGEGADVIVNSSTIESTATAAASKLFDLSGLFSSATSGATATGIDGGNGDDRIESTGTVTVSATASSVLADISFPPLDSSALAPPGARANATGIEGGAGMDTVTNSGTLGVTAAASTSGGKIQLGLSDVKKTDATLTADAAAAGIRVTESGLIINNGTVSVTSTASVVGWTGKVNILDLATANTYVTPLSTATGILGGAGFDTITNAGSISVLAKADATLPIVEVNAIDAAVAGAGIGTADKPMSAGATGIDTGNGGSEIVNSVTGGITARAESSANLENVVLTLYDFTITSDMKKNGGSIATNVDATATGIKGGSGDDRITNNGEINALAMTNVLSLGLGVGAEGVPSGFSAPSADFYKPLFTPATADITATADATGIQSGDGNDTIVNTGKITAYAGPSDSLPPMPNVAALGGSISFPLLELTGLSDWLGKWNNLVDFPPAIAVAGAGTLAETAATGINAGEGNDHITNDENPGSSVTVSAMSFASTDQGSLTMQNVSSEGGTGWSANLDLALAKATTQATATATGLDGAAGDDIIENKGLVDVDADATAIGTAVSVDAVLLKGMDKVKGWGLAASAALTNVATEATATATGIAGGGGDDSIYNFGQTDVDAKAVANSFSADVSVQGEIKGLGGGVTFADTSTTSTATTVGISGSDGADRIFSGVGIGGPGSLHSHADAEAYAETFTVTVQKESKGVEIGGALAKGSLTATAIAAGIDGGAGNDVLGNETFGLTDVKAEATVNNLTATVDVQAGVKGVGVGVALIDTTTATTANAVGISGGTGEDYVVNNALSTLKSYAVSNAYAESFSVSVQGESTGLVLGGSLVIGSTTADSMAVGIDGGEDKDEIRNLGMVDANATSTTNNLAVGVDVQGTVNGVGAGFAFTDASSTATAQATGVSGGTGDDTISNSADSTIKAYADANAYSDLLTVNVQGNSTGIVVGGAVALADSTATTTAVGINGGTGKNTITNQAYGTVDVNASSTANSLAFTVAVQGAVEGFGGQAALTDTSTFSTATVMGISGGADQDTITNGARAILNSHAAANAYAESITANVQGEATGVTLSGSLARGETTPTATATGISGGAGADTLTNDGFMDVQATTDSTSVAVAARAVGVIEGISVGASLTDTSTTANATATGIDGGDDNDTISNYRSIVSKTDSTLRAASVSVDFGGVPIGVSVGAALSRAAANATGIAKGIDGGTGNDTISNAGYGLIDVDSIARSTSTAVSISANVIGAAWTDTSATTSTRATGISGNDGNDNITNLGEIDADSNSTADVANVSVNLIGATPVSGWTSSTASAVGIDGGSGNDRIENQRIVKVGSNATTVATGVAVQIAGYSDMDITTNAIATATGITGGSGTETITNADAGSIQATATVNADATAVDINLIGYSTADGKSTGTATATGIDGGDGVNTITNLGSIVGTATVTADAKSYDIQLAGGAQATAGTEATATAMGISGGTDTDTLRNEGTINLTSQTTLTATSRSYKIIGVGLADASSKALACATGVDGAGGSNTITNTSTGTITVSSNAGADAGGVTAVAIGIAGATANTTSKAQSIGFRSGGGQDTINNFGVLNVKATSSTAAGSGTFSLFGLSFGDGLSTAVADGIDAGGGDDSVRNAGSLTVGSVQDNNHPMSYSNVESVTIGFGSITSAGLGAKSGASGILGGAGNDTIRNEGTLTVGSDYWMSKGRAYGFTGSFLGMTSVGASADTVSLGIAGGDGANTLINDTAGLLTVKASSHADTTGAARTVAGVIGAFSSAASTASATGINGGKDNDTVENRGTIDILAHTWATSFANSRIGWGNPTAEASATATATAAGIDPGEGTDIVTNSGILKVNALAETSPSSNADSDVDETFATTTANAYSTALGIATGDEGATVNNTATGGITVIATANSYDALNNMARSNSDENATVTAGLTGSAIGIQAGSGNDSIYNDGQVTVTAAVNSKTHATASSLETDLIAVATTKTGGAASATGISAGDGNNTVRNGGGLTVTATTIGTALSDYPSAHLDCANAYAGAEGLSLTAEAFGIVAGNGVNSIDNYNSITVSSSVDADALGYSNTATTDTFSKAYAGGNAGATGIAVGNGQNTIDNHGSLTVTATADAYALGSAEEYGYAYVGSASSPGIIARAVGISAGNGANTIKNYGSLQVGAVATGSAEAAGDDTQDHYASASAGATGIRTGGGNNTITNLGTISVSAYSMSSSAVGIQTGAGNDVVVNNGSITTANGLLPLPFFSSPGTAIYTGAGNDQVLLGNGSRTTGRIDLGDGDDLLIFRGTPQLTGTLTGAAGTDTLVFDGSGSIAFTPEAFEQAIKQGAGTFTVPALPTMQRIEVSQGVLETNSNYQFSAGGLIRTVVNGDGSFGQFRVNGNALLAGDLSVLKGPGPYLNGTTYRIIESANAAGVSGAFSAITLPEAKPLVGFNVRQLQDAVQVEVETRSFTTVATNPVEWAVAGYLDRIMPTATGDLSDVLGEFQSLAQPQFHTAFSSLSPATYDGLSKAGLAGLKQYQNSLSQRMSNVRAYNVAAGYGSEPQRVLLAYNGSDANLGRFLAGGQGSRSQAGIGLWIDSYGQWGDQRGAQGVTGYDYDLYGGTIGYDSTFPNNLMLGISMGTSRAAIDFDENMGDGSVKDVTGSLYGSYLLGDAYIEGVLSYGRERFQNHRRLSIGSMQRDALSSHSGDAYSVYLGAGYDYKVGNSAIIPFVAIRYAHLDEEGFSESGAGSLDLTLDRRRTDSLVSELGVRAARAYKLNSGSLIPEFSAAFSYDFDIDDRVITSSFAGSPGAAFSIKGQQVEKYGAVVNAGLTFIHDSGVSTSIKYSGEFRERSSSHGVIGNLRYQF
ncbi:MAG: autotransporter outer membrane beta-barrel domain-containing protein [Geobacteraceae bacterium]|nr:autotransporter outer membrane beta-barrel domain-containing protein [Geobacteraceae bacterium]